MVAQKVSSKTGGESSSSAAPTNTFANDGSFLARFQAQKAAQTGSKTASSNSSTACLAAVAAQPGSSSASPVPVPVGGGVSTTPLDALARKKAMEERIRNRGKRRAASPELDVATFPQEQGIGLGAKRRRSEEADARQAPASKGREAYLQQLRRAETANLKDAGAGVRPLAK